MITEDINSFLSSGYEELGFKSEEELLNALEPLMAERSLLETQLPLYN